MQAFKSTATILVEL